MKKSTTSAKRNRSSLNLRITADDRYLIDRAAESTGKTRTNFVLDATRRAAEEVLIERVMFSVSKSAYTDFLARLEEPTQPNERLRHTMQVKTPWPKT